MGKYVAAFELDSTVQERGQREHGGSPSVLGLPPCMSTSATGLHGKHVLSDSPLCVTEEHEGVEDICDKLTDLVKFSLPPTAPPPPPASTTSPTPTGGKHYPSLIALLPLLCLSNI